MGFLVVLYFDDNDIEDVKDKLDGLVDEPDDLRGLYKIPTEDTNFCEHEEESRREINTRPMNKKFGVLKGRKYGWSICSVCKRAIRKWHHVPFNLVEEECDPDGKLFLNWDHAPSKEHREYRKRKRQQRNA